MTEFNDPVSKLISKEIANYIYFAYTFANLTVINNSKSPLICVRVFPYILTIIFL